MATACACSTLFQRIAPEELIERYEENADPANGYLTQVGDWWELVDAQASEMADWSRQTQLAADLAEEDTLAISVFLAGDSWALALATAGKQGPVAVFTPDDTDVLERLPHQLLAIENNLEQWLPGDIDAEKIDAIFGAILEGALPADEGLDELLILLGCSPDWLRWSWYEAIPLQLITDPDFVGRVQPLGEAKALWEE
ncbi:MAG: hypothetical protein ACYC7E_04390 [Armatimonadota bacterium]